MPENFRPPQNTTDHHRPLQTTPGLPGNRRPLQNIGVYILCDTVPMADTKSVSQ